MAHAHRFIPLAVAVGVVAAAPAAARADSLTFVKDGQVWISRADGGSARPVTTARNNWAWPSMADDGTLFAAGGVVRVNQDGSDSDGSTEIYHLDQQGHQIGGAVETFGSRSTPACPTDAPTYLRVSPDGSRAAFNQLDCDNRDSFLQDLATGRQTRISSDYSASQWLDDGHILVTHIGPTFGNAAYASYDVASPGNSHGPTDDPYLPEYLAVASRSGNRVAVYEADPLIDGSGVASADIRLNSTTGNDVTQPTEKCVITLDAAKALTIIPAAPTVSPDGTRLAWAEKDGIHVADIGNLDDCATVTERLVVAGGGQPFFGTQDPQEAPAPVALSSSTRRATVSRKGRVTIKVTTSDAAALRARGWVKAGGKRVRFRTAHAAATAGQPARITLALRRRVARRVRAALRHHHLKGHFTVRATTSDGRSGKLALVLSLRR